jgi:DNA-binding NarL/FixJ family response regulator
LLLLEWLNDDTLTRVVLADDHTLVLEAFRLMLSGDVEVVGTATDGRELIKVIKGQKPDVVVTDLAMPVLNGLDAGIKLHQADARPQDHLPYRQ